MNFADKRINQHRMTVTQMTPPPSFLIHIIIVHKNTPSFLESIRFSELARHKIMCRNYLLAWPAKQCVPGPRKAHCSQDSCAYWYDPCLDASAFLLFSSWNSLFCPARTTVPRDNSLTVYTSEQPQHKGCKSIHQRETSFLGTTLFFATSWSCTTTTITWHCKRIYQTPHTLVVVSVVVEE